MKEIYLFFRKIRYFHRIDVALLLVLQAVIMFAIGMFTTVFISSLYEMILKEQPVGWFACWSMGILWLLMVAREKVQQTLEEIYFSIECCMKAAIREKGMEMPFEQYMTQQWGTKMKKIDQSLVYSGGVKVLMGRMGQLVSRVISIVLSILVILRYVASHVGIILMSLALLIGVGLWISNRSYQKNTQLQKQKYKEMMALEGQLHYYLFHVINDYSKNKSIQMNQAQSFLLEKYNELIQKSAIKNMDYLTLRTKNQRVTSVMTILLFFVSFLGANLLIGSSSLSLILVMALFTFSNALSNIFMAAKEVELSVNRLEKLPEFLEETKQIQEETTQKDAIHTITFDHVSFRYPNSDTFVLEDVSLTLDLHSLRKIAIVGKNGSGKSTLLKLLLKLYQPTSGAIYCNGINIQDISDEVYYQQVSLLPQQYTILNDSMGANISCQQMKNDQKILNFMEMIGEEQWLSQFPDGLDTVVETDVIEGVKLSQGQKQKLATLRTLYKNTPFIVLDEPSASLDPVTETELFQLIDRESNKHQFLFVTHKMAACLLSEWIIVLENGKIVGQGTHDDLMNTSPVYRELFTSQVIDE